MPNEVRIDEIISDKALKQFKTLESLLESAQNKFADSVIVVNKFNDALANSKGQKAFVAAQTQLATATEKVNQAQADTAKKAADLAALQETLASKAVSAIQKQQAATDKKVAADKASTASSQAAATAIQAQAAATDKSTASTTKYTSSLIDNVKQGLALKSQQADLKQSQTDLDKSYADGTTSAEDYAKQTADLTKKQADLKVQVQANNTAAGQSAKIESTATGAYQKKSATLDQLRVAYKNLNAEEAKDPEKGGKLLADIKSLSDELKKTDDSLGENTRNVGNYKSALQNLGITNIGEQLKGLGANFKALGAVILANPLIAILVAALSIIYESLKNNADAVAYFSGIFKAFGTIVKNVGKVISDFFLPIIELIVDSVLLLAEGLGRLTGAYDLSTDKIKEAAAASVAYEKILKQLSEAASIVSVDVSKYALAISAQNEIVKNATKNIFQRVAALDAQSFIEKKSVAERLLLIDVELQATIRLAKTQKAGGEDRIATNAKIRELQVQRNTVLLEQQDLENTIVKRRSALLNEDVQNRKKAAEDANKIDEALSNSEYELLKQRISTSAASFKEVADNEDQSLNVRLVSQQAYYSKERDLLLLERNKQLTDNNAATKEALAQENLTADQIIEINQTSYLNKLKINEKYHSDLLNTEKENGKERLAIIQSELNQEVDLITKQIEANAAANAKASAKQLNELNAARDTEIAALNSKDKKYEENKAAIQEKYLRQYLADQIAATEQTIEVNKNAANIIGLEEQHLAELRTSLTQQGTVEEKKAIQDQIDALTKQIDIQKQGLEDTSALEAQLADEKVKLNEADVKNTKKTTEEKNAIIQQALQITSAIANQALSYTQTLSDNLYNSQIKNITDAQNAADARYDSEIQGIENSSLADDEKAAREASINKQKDLADKKSQADQEKAAIQKAKRDRAIQIGNIIANTAVAVLAQLAVVPAGFALAAAAAAVGALQLAAVLSTPIPSYRHGGEMPYDGMARYSEEGREMLVEPSGKISLTPKNETIGFLKKGTKIFNHRETEKIMAQMSLSSYMQKSGDTNIDVSAIVRSNEEAATRIIKGYKKIAPKVIKNGNRITYKTQA